MGVYGNMLDVFPELFRTVSFWKRNPCLGAGYDKGEEQHFNVIILADSQAGFQDKKALEYKALDFKNHDVLYSRTNTPIEKGMFLRHPDDGDIFIVDYPFDYAFTGGFRMWGIDRVQGANSTNEGYVALKEGVY